MNQISNIYLILLFPKECRDNEEKSDRLFEKLMKNGDLDWLLISAYDKTKNQFLDLPQGGAFQQQVVIDLLKNHHKKLYREYMSALDHQDKLYYLMAKITRWADKKIQQMSILKTAKSKIDASVYMQCYLVKYFENDSLPSKKHCSDKSLM